MVIIHLQSASEHSNNILMMRIGQHEPIEAWGLEPCGAYMVPTSSLGKEQGVATRRTPLGRGAAHSRSNVAEHIPFGNGGQFRPLKGQYYDREKFESSAAAPSLEDVGEMDFQVHCLNLSDSGFLPPILRWRLSATSKKAL